MPDQKVAPSLGQPRRRNMIGPAALGPPSRGLGPDLTGPLRGDEFRAVDVGFGVSRSDEPANWYPSSKLMMPVS
jgi:hypothetical protein